MDNGSHGEAGIRLGIFLGVFILIALWEIANPRRQNFHPKLSRWTVNLGLSVLNILFARLTVGALAYTIAVFARDKGWGFFNYIETPIWVAIIVSIILLDFAVYLQHVIVHALPVFWRLHRVHHTDLDFDVTTGLRFHPLEILLSLTYKAGLVIIIGVPPWAILAFEVILSASSLFNHGNVYIPRKLDYWLRWIIVTPDMHRIHHSTIVDETNSNFGFSVSWWDRLCGTYKNTASKDQLKIEIGLKEFPNQKDLGLFNLIILPFLGKMGHYSYQKENQDS